MSRVLRPTKKEMISEILELRNTGSVMSNILLNLSQSDGIEAGYRATMAQLVRKWDAIPRTATVLKAAPNKK